MIGYSVVFHPVVMLLVLEINYVTFDYVSDLGRLTPKTGLLCRNEGHAIRNPPVRVTSSFCLDASM